MVENGNYLAVLRGENEDKERTPVYYCSCCNEPIYDGDYYYPIDGEKVCEYCIEDFKEKAVK